MHFLIKDLQEMWNINDVSSSQICTLAIYQSCFIGGATTIREGRVNWPACLSALRAGLKYRSKLSRKQYYHCITTTNTITQFNQLFLFPTPVALPFAVLLEEKAEPHASMDILALLEFFPRSNTNPTRMLSANILTCACAVDRTKVFFGFLFFLPPLFFF